MREGLLVSLCTYNERANLEMLIPAIFEYAPHAHIVIIDDNSPDGTGDYADELNKKNPAVRVVHRPKKMGLGTAAVAAFNYAIDNNYEFLVNLDADFSHHPRHIPALLDCMQRVDVAIGSRYVKGGGVEGWGIKRHLMSRCINLYAKLLLGLKTRDNSGSYRCYRVAKLAELDLSLIRSKGYAFLEEVLYRLRRLGCRFEESPIFFANRRFGQTKINMREASSALWVIFRLGVDRVLRTSVRKPVPTTVPVTAGTKSS